MKKTFSEYLSVLLFVTAATLSLFATSDSDLTQICIMGIWSVLAANALTGPNWSLGRISGWGKTSIMAVPLIFAMLIINSTMHYFSFFEARITAYLFLTLLLMAGSTLAIVGLMWFGIAVLFAGMSIWGLYDFLVLQQLARGPFEDPNLYGAVMLVGACVTSAAFFHVKQDGKVSKYSMLGVATFCGIAAVLSHSRSAWLALIAALIVVLVVFRKKLNLPAMRAVLAVAMVSVLALISVYGKTRSDLGQNQGFGESANSRMALLIATKAMIEEKPLVGQGWGLWNVSYLSHRLPQDTDSAGSHAHNDYLEAWATGGLAGLLLILSVPITLFVLTKKALRSNKVQSSVVAALAVGAATLIIQAGLNFVYHQVFSCLLLGALLGTLFALSKEAETQVGPRQQKPVHVKLIAALLIPAVLAVGILEYLAVLPTRLMDGRPIDANSPKTLVLAPQVLSALSSIAPVMPGPSYVLGMQAQFAAAAAKGDEKKQKQFFDSAIGHFEEALSKNPFEMGCLYNEALIWHSYPGLGDAERFAKVEALAKRALAVNPGFFDFVSMYASLLVKHGKTVTAELVIENARQHSDKHKRVVLDKLKNELVEYEKELRGN